MSVVTTLERTPLVEVAALNGAAAARSRLYQCFSYLFSYPTAEVVSERYGAAAGNDVALAVTGLPFDFDDEVAELTRLLGAHGGLSEMLAARYTALFDNCTGRVRVSLREANYVRKDTRYLWEELVRFYEHFGLDYTLDRTRVWPDHVTVQTDVMHYLSFLEAAGADHAQLGRAQLDFLTRHLGAWSGDFAASFSIETEVGIEVEPFASFGQLLSRFVTADLDYLKQQ